MMSVRYSLANVNTKMGGKNSPFTFALSQLVLPTATLPEICHGRQLGMQRSHSIPPVVQRLDCSSCFCFVFESRIYISEKVVADIVANNHFLEVSIFGQFAEKIVSNQGLGTGEIRVPTHMKKSS